MGWEDHDWVSEVRTPGRDDRLFRRYRSAIPPVIAAEPVALDSGTAEAAAQATAAIARLDTESAFDISALGALLIRSESVASSVLIGAVRPKSLAGRVAANVSALQRSLDIAFDDSITAATFADIHRVLMLADDHLAAEAGVYRIEQNWIGGSDYTPRNAVFVPPAPERVSGLVDDLARFVVRTDLPAVVQAGIARRAVRDYSPVR